MPKRHAKLIMIVAVMAIIAVDSQLILAHPVGYHAVVIKNYAMSKIIQAENWPIRDCQLKFDSTSARNMCIRAVARSKKDYLLCKQISDSTNLNACIRDVAREIQDVSLCKHINDEWQHGLCVVGIARDAQDTRLCQSLTGQSREYCFSEVAEATSDLKLCDESGGYKSGCIDTIKKKTRDVNEKKITKDVAIEIAKRRLQKESFANDIDFGKFTVHFREKTNDYVVDFACKGCNEIFPGLWSGGYSVAVDANTGNIKEGGFGPYKR